jgi:hypothetical protein
MKLGLLFSRPCCGGPALWIALTSGSFGLLFLMLAATAPGLVFLATGAGSLGLCLLMSRSRCLQRGRNCRSTT